MQDHVEPPLLIDDMAARLGLSTRGLQRLFAHAFGMPPKRYYDLIRLHRARKLLVETDLPITEVALRCGYMSPTQFSARFREILDCRPCGNFGRRLLTVRERDDTVDCDSKHSVFRPMMGVGRALGQGHRR